MSESAYADAFEMAEETLNGRVIVATIIGAMLFIQISLLSKTVEPSSADIETYNLVYKALAALLFVYVALPIASFGIEHRTTAIGKWTLFMVAFSAVVGVALQVWLVVSLTLALVLSLGILGGYYVERGEAA